MSQYDIDNLKGVSRVVKAPSDHIPTLNIFIFETKNFLGGNWQPRKKADTFQADFYRFKKLDLVFNDDIDVDSSPRRSVESNSHPADNRIGNFVVI
jgi:hypothetical protein